MLHCSSGGLLGTLVVFDYVFYRFGVAIFLVTAGRLCFQSVSEMRSRRLQFWTRYSREEPKPIFEGASLVEPVLKRRVFFFRL